MNTYQLSPGKWQKENNNIQQILTNNGYRNTILENTSRREKPKKTKTKHSGQNSHTPGKK